MKVHAKGMEVVEHEYTLNPEFCYEKAAEILVSGRAINNYGVNVDERAVAEEWRLLGDSLARWLVGAQ